MKKYRFNKYFQLSVLWLSAWIFLWFLLSYWFVVTGRTAVGHNFSDVSILKSLFRTNYQGLRVIIGGCSLPFLLSLNYLLFDENSLFFIRFSSRHKFLLKNVFISLLFSFIVAFLHEAVSVIGCIFTFGFSLVQENSIPIYSVFNTLSIWIYFFRISLVLLLARTIISKKYAHFIVFALYFTESCFFTDIFAESFWLPCQDVTVIGNLLYNSVNYFDVSFVLLRGILLCAVVLMIILLRAEKKDVLSDEKK